MLHAIQHDNKSKLWCGPAAIATVTGAPTSAIHRIARIESGRTKIASMNTYLLIKVLAALGYRMVTQIAGDNLTLAAWAKRYRAMYAKRPVIVNVTGHYVTLCGRRFIDNHTRDGWVPIGDAPHRRARVKQAWIFAKERDVPIAPLMPPPKTDPHRKARIEAKAIAREYGIEIARENDLWWVYGPDWIEEEGLDPFDGDHMAESWPEILSRVNDYRRLIERHNRK